MFCDPRDEAYLDDVTMKFLNQLGRNPSGTHQSATGHGELDDDANLCLCIGTWSETDGKLRHDSYTYGDDGLGLNRKGWWKSGWFTLALCWRERGMGDGWGCDGSCGIDGVVVLISYAHPFTRLWRDSATSTIGIGDVMLETCLIVCPVSVTMFAFCTFCDAVSISPGLLIDLELKMYYGERQGVSS